MSSYSESHSRTIICTRKRAPESFKFSVVIVMLDRHHSLSVISRPTCMHADIDGPASFKHSGHGSALRTRELPVSACARRHDKHLPHAAAMCDSS